MNRICMMFWICACCISTSAQIEIDHSQLIGTKWQRIEPVVRNVNSYMQFTETCIVDSIYYSTLEKSASGSKDYYITNETPSWVKKEEGVISLCITLRSMKLTTTPSCHLQMTN